MLSAIFRTGVIKQLDSRCYKSRLRVASSGAKSIQDLTHDASSMKRGHEAFALADKHE